MFGNKRVLCLFILENSCFLLSGYLPKQRLLTEATPAFSTVKSHSFTCPKILAEPAGKARQRSSIAKDIWKTKSVDPKNFGCDVSVRPYRLWGRGRGKSQGNPTGSGECHLFLEGNRAVLLGNRRFSWREIA